MTDIHVRTGPEKAARKPSRVAEDFRDRLKAGGFCCLFCDGANERMPQAFGDEEGVLPIVLGLSASWVDKCSTDRRPQSACVDSSEFGCGHVKMPSG